MYTSEYQKLLQDFLENTADRLQAVFSNIQPQQYYHTSEQVLLLPKIKHFCQQRLAERYNNVMAVKCIQQYMWQYMPCLINYPVIFHTVSQKNCAKLFLSELCQLSTNCENFWHKDGKEDKLMWGALVFHLTKVLTKTILHSFFRHGVLWNAESQWSRNADVYMTNIIIFIKHGLFCDIMS